MLCQIPKTYMLKNFNDKTQLQVLQKTESCRWLTTIMNTKSFGNNLICFIKALVYSQNVTLHHPDENLTHPD